MAIFNSYVSLPDSILDGMSMTSTWMQDQAE